MDGRTEAKAGKAGPLWLLLYSLSSFGVIGIIMCIYALSGVLGDCSGIHEAFMEQQLAASLLILPTLPYTRQSVR
jgi:hypothetical protein